MRLQETQIAATVEGEQSGGQFGISKNDTGHILVILRDKLYSDKVMAVLREYGTNALDAHVESGQADRPIKVVLPTRFSPTLTIRDYGTGLSEEQVYTIYTQYGRSTKRNSDNAIGQLGLGCKSAFAYSQQFTVTSWHNGKKMIFNAFIDPSNEGRMTKLMEAKCDPAETGIEVSIPIKERDITTFHHKAQQCYYYFEPQPEINIELRSPEYAMKRGWWRVKTHFDQDQSQPMAVMGSIGYPLRAERIPHLTEDERSLMGLPLEIRFGIGELSISANREDLEYTDHTVKNIRQRLHAIKTELETEVNKQFAGAKTAWEARLLYWKYLEVMETRAPTTGSSWSHRQTSDFIQRLVNRLAMWNGIKLSNQRWNKANFGSINKGTIKQLFGSMTRFSTRWSLSNYFSVNPKTVIYVANSKTAYLQRILQNRDGDCLVYVPDTPGDVDMKALNAWITSYGLTGIPVIETEKLPYDPKLNSTIGTTGPSAAVAAKANLKVFKLKANFSPTAHPKSNNWEPSQVDKENGTGIYVGLYHYLPEASENKPIDLHTMHQQFQTLMDLGGPNYQAPEVIGIKRKDANSMGSNWQTWDSWYKKEYTRLLKAANIAQEVADYAAVSAAYYDYNCYLNSRDNRLSVLASKVGGDNIFAKVHRELSRSRDKLTEMNKSPRLELYRRLQNDIELMDGVTSNYASHKAIQEMKAAYPLLEPLNFWTTFTVSPELFDNVYEYVKMVNTYNDLTQKEET